KGGFAFPLEGRLLGDQAILRRDGLTLHFSFGDVPLRRFEVRGTLDRHQTVGPGASLYAEATCTDVPNYGPLLYLTGICNLSDTVAAAGTYLAHRYDPSGGASRRPVGVTVTDVAL